MHRSVAAAVVTLLAGALLASTAWANSQNSAAIVQRGVLMALLTSSPSLDDVVERCGQYSMLAPACTGIRHVARDLAEMHCQLGSSVERVSRPERHPAENALVPRQCPSSRGPRAPVTMEQAIDRVAELMIKYVPRETFIALEPLLLRQTDAPLETRRALHKRDSLWTRLRTFNSQRTAYKDYAVSVLRRFVGTPADGPMGRLRPLNEILYGLPFVLFYWLPLTSIVAIFAVYGGIAWLFFLSTYTSIETLLHGV